MLHLTLAIFTIISICKCGKLKNKNNKKNKCDYYLFNKDFELGTYRIRKSGTYCLSENISFNPRVGTSASPNQYGSWFPVDENEYPGSVSHDDGGYALGFFTAICIETSDVSLDLQGYEIAMSLPFYLQQRWFNIIEIQTAAFNFGQGPANFGETVNKIENIHIRNGILGRSSHNGLHAFDVENVYISDLTIYNFEVAGLQFNGFHGVHISNVNIGPASTEVPFLAYYSHARFSLTGFELIDEKDLKYIRFQGDREVTLQEIEDNLRMSLDMAYRYKMNILTPEDIKNPLYDVSIQLYDNKFGLADGSAQYGMIFNSAGLAVQGFGDSENENESQGDTLNIENVNIHDLHLNTNEIPALYLDRCEGHYFNEDGSVSLTPILGRFGDLFDIRRSLKCNKNFCNWHYMNNGWFSYEKLVYTGNPLSDAQIALNIFSDAFVSNWGIESTEDKTMTRGKETFYRWATDYNNPKYNSLPQCARFACNGDAMFHTIKGIIGVRLDGIENVIIKDLRISDLFNETPLASLACGVYDGPENGGQPKQLKKEGFMGSDIRGISIINGGNVELYGGIELENFIASTGDVIGIHLMDDASVYIDDEQRLYFNDFEAGAMISNSFYQNILDHGVCPYPNNFYDCNIRAEQLEDREDEDYPFVYTSNGEGYIYPLGVVTPQCKALYDN